MPSELFGGFGRPPGKVVDMGVHGPGTVLLVILLLLASQTAPSVTVAVWLPEWNTAA
jgi:hypothetical protein